MKVFDPDEVVWVIMFYTGNHLVNGSDSELTAFVSPRDARAWCAHYENDGDTIMGGPGDHREIFALAWVRHPRMASKPDVNVYSLKPDADEDENEASPSADFEVVGEVEGLFGEHELP